MNINEADSLSSVIGKVSVSEQDFYWAGDHFVSIYDTEFNEIFSTSNISYIETDIQFDVGESYYINFGYNWDRQFIDHTLHGEEHAGLRLGVQFDGDIPIDLLIDPLKIDLCAWASVTDPFGNKAFSKDCFNYPHTNPVPEPATVFFFSIGIACLTIWKKGFR
jgi:hypothetical protein